MDPSSQLKRLSPNNYVFFFLTGVEAPFNDPLRWNEGVFDVRMREWTPPCLKKTFKDHIMHGQLGLNSRVYIRVR